MIFDAHLDLAYNALRGREVLRPAREQVTDAEGIPTVGLPDLRAGHVTRICATIFCEPKRSGPTGYTTPAEAFEMATAQLDWYHAQFDAGEMKLIDSTSGGASDSSRAIETIILLEGADPMRTPDDVAHFFARGVHVVGLAWKRTRYAGGTGEPGPLTPEGVELVRELDRVGMIHDASHLAEESFWQLLKLTDGPIVASHSNARALVPTDRQLSDDMARAVASRGGVIGINFFDKFLVAPAEYGRRRATLDDVVTHVRHFCNVIGSTRHVGLGTDMDGGLGREQIPVEIQTSADLPRVADALRANGFDDTDVQNIMGENWTRFFEQNLK